MEFLSLEEKNEKGVAEVKEKDIEPENDEDNDDEEEGGEENAENAGTGSSAAGKKKKRKNKKKKKSKTAGASAGGAKESSGAPGKVAPSRLLGGYTDYYLKYGQTDPPTRPVSSLFANGIYPEGEILPHGATRYPLDDSFFQRETTEEKREKERLLHAELYNKVRLAAEVHREVRRYAQSIIRPGILLTDMCDALEDCNRRLVEEKGLKCGIAFPTGCSLNHVAAHYSPNSGDLTRLGSSDVMKVDFGTQIDGRIIDCAWTVCFDEQFDPLLAAVKEATDTGIKAAGVDVLLGEVGEAVQEVMESHTITLRGQDLPILCCRNLNGHSISPYQIHGGKSVPIVKTVYSTSPATDSVVHRMEEGEFYAIETFGSTGRGYVLEEGECSHYMKEYSHPPPYVPLKLPSAKKLLNHINKTFGTLAFCRRWLERPDGGSFAVNSWDGRQENYLGALRSLCDAGIVNAYPPLVDVPGSYVAQYEHTLLLRPTCKEVLSRGEDF